MDKNMISEEQPPAEKKSFLLKLAEKAEYARHRKLNPGPGYAWPMGAWFTIFFIVPIAIIICYSFMKRDTFGGVIHEFSIPPNTCSGLIDGTKRLILFSLKSDFLNSYFKISAIGTIF